jgi:alkanesulfonate monooxygenase SsuD/methylene tetrahydromethanopterin reductase-like flavin-dependent oxidoreductase (luciferase family)
VNKNVARRIARFGSAWITWDITADEMASSIATMRELVAEHGGDAASLPVQGEVYLERDSDGRMDLAKTFADLPVLAAAGVTDVTLYRLRLPPDTNRAAHELMDIVTAFRVAVGRAPLTEIRSA